jgi:hypothetical protein
MEFEAALARVNMSGEIIAAAEAVLQEDRLDEREGVAPIER